MKKTKLALMLLILGFFSSTASAAWYVEYRSPSAWGWGLANSYAEAAAIAKNNCVYRTPLGQWCTLSFQEWRP